MYKEYFGLKELPFSIAPDPRYLYMSNQHREALAHLIYGINTQGGFVLLTGEVGTGKTTVCRCLLDQMPENIDVAFILNPKMTSEELSNIPKAVTALRFLWTILIYIFSMLIQRDARQFLLLKKHKT